MMNILQRYILKQYLLIFTFTMIFLQGIFVVVRTMEMIDIFLRSKDLTAETLVLYYLYEMPFTLNYMFPIATLFSIVLCLGKMNTSSELISLYNSGHSIFYYLSPIIVILAIICTLFMVKDYEIYYKSHQNHMEIHRKLSGRDFFAAETSAENGLVQFGSDNKIYIVSTFLPTEKKLLNTKIVYFDEKYSITNISKIDTGEYLGNGKWKINKGSHRKFFNKDSKTITKNVIIENEILDLGDDPKLFKPIPHMPVHLSHHQVSEEIKRLIITGGNTKKWLTEYHSKIAIPYTPLIIFFLGVPLSSFSRRSVLGLSFFFVLIIAFFYMALHNIGMAMGENGTLPPILAGWLGNIIFGIIAIIMHKKTQN